MRDRQSGRGFTSRPGTAEAWVTAPEDNERSSPRSSGNSARLTIDVTPQLRARIKIAAFQRGTTVANMVRDMLRDAFSEGDDVPP